MKNTECLTCGLTLLTAEPLGPAPLKYDDCPNCGANEFEFVE